MTSLIPIPRKRRDPEFLDLPSDRYAREELEGSLADIRVINRYLGDQRALIKHLAGLAAGASSFTLLDIATGSADLPVAVARWARGAGIAASVTGVDINEQTVAIAREHAARYPEIEVRVADGLNLPFAARSFDFVVCSKTAHHLDHDSCVRLMQEMLRVARRGFLVMDLRRSWIAYFLIRMLTMLFTRNRLTRNDGPLSVLRSFTPGELASLATRAGASRFTVTREPFWLLVLSGEVE